MRIYLAGPMRGIPLSNFPAFDAAAATLRGEGHEVFNPADHDRKCGLDGSAEVTEELLREMFRADTDWICTQADAIALLPGWRNSKGATAEHTLAIALGLKVIKLEPDTAPRRYLGTDSAARKRMPLATGLFDYFPDATTAVAEVSFHGNEKHNPGQPLHHARGKSNDHADCIARHLVERGGFDGPIRHSAALAWRALALLQEELEAESGLSLPRGATAPGVELEAKST